MREIILKVDGSRRGLGNEWGNLYTKQKAGWQEMWSIDQSNDLMIMQTSRMNLPKCGVFVTIVFLELVDRRPIEHKQGTGHVNLKEYVHPACGGVSRWHKVRCPARHREKSTIFSGQEVMYLGYGLSWNKKRSRPFQSPSHYPKGTLMWQDSSIKP